MSNSSTSELVLKIESAKTDEYQYVYKPTPSPRGKKIYPRAGRKKIRNISKYKYSRIYDAVNPHSHLLLLISVVLVCLYYTVVLRVEQKFFIEKYYHSFSLGIICLIDFLVNRETFQTVKVSEEYDNNVNNIKEPLLTVDSVSSSDIKNKMLTFKEFLFYVISLGIVSFTTELFTFYLLNETTLTYNYNASIGFALICFDVIMIRFHYSMQDVKIEFLNFLGLLTIFCLFLFISMTYLSLPLGGVAFFVSALKFAKFYLFMDLNNYSYLNLNKVVLLMNFIDFGIGCTIVFVELILYDYHLEFIFSHFFLILVATLCFYINIKYLRDFDKYGMSIMALCFPLMIVFDLFINRRRINFPELLLIIIMTISVVFSFIGDKIWNEDEYLGERKNQHHPLHHRKDEEELEEEKQSVFTLNKK
jgi:hypothetical protein